MIRLLLVVSLSAAGFLATDGFASSSCSSAGAGPCPAYDRDGDGIYNDQPDDGPDNCPDTKNADQTNTDGDRLGDACDPDDDGDGVPDTSDNCQFVPNPDQDPSACPPKDTDGDGVADDVDNCPALGQANPGQEDLDQDRRGDICDSDDDSDGVADDVDNCPRVENASQQDRDGDGIGTACDPDDLRSTSADGTGTSPGTGPGMPSAAADSAAPTLSLVRTATWTADDLRGSAPIRVGCSEACGLTARLTLRGRLIAKGTALLGGRGRTYVFLTPRRGAVATVARLRRATTVTLTVRAVDEAGNRRSVTRRITLRR